MHRFWWVNHNKTARQEIEGQYLWSPKRKRDGARNEFYNNMRRANPGDLVLSYAKQVVRYVGRVADYALTGPKPVEFGDTGANWSDVGWHLPVYWTPLEPPVRPKEIIEVLAPVLPTRYSPVDPNSGRGRQNAYLAEIPEPVFDIIVAHTSYSDDALARGGANSLSFEVLIEKLDEIVERSIAADSNLDDTVKDSIIRARRGQGRFRANVEEVENACRLTGITNRSLLIASHIKPWRLCTSATERLDGMNGLLLTPDADLLFDRGFITFEDDGVVKVSDRVDHHDLRRLGFDQLAWERFGVAEAPAVWRTGGFLKAQREYLAFHRSEVFIEDPDGLSPH